MGSFKLLVPAQKMRDITGPWASLDFAGLNGERIAKYEVAAGTVIAVVQAVHPRNDAIPAPDAQAGPERAARRESGDPVIPRDSRRLRPPLGRHPLPQPRQ